MENLQKKIQILLSLYKSKNFSKAEMYNKELLKIHPKIVFLYNSMGLIFTEQNRLDEAIRIYNEGIKVQSDYAMIYNNLGTVYKIKNDFKKAKNYYKESIKLDKKIPEPYNNLGNLFLSLGMHDKAINFFKKAIKTNPKFFPSHYNLASVYINTGKYEYAKKHFNISIKLNPYFYPAHRNLSSLIKYSKDNKHFKLLIKLYDDNKQNAELAFALGKAFDDIKDFKNAFEYYKIGNNIRRKDVIFSLDTEKEFFIKIKNTFNKDLFDKFKNKNSSSSCPIFILGMPRSGTTLIEQILSSHKIVYGGDELNFLPNLVDKYFKNQDDDIFLDNIATFNKKKFKNIGDEYVANIKKISKKSKRVTDKLPINFKWIGLIKLILPNAKIVHCVRNSRDTCLSIFKNYFVNTKLNFAYNLEEITEFYKLYDDIMKHWKLLFPNFIVEIKYENVIANPEKEIRNLLKNCRLSWDKNCLKFYNNKRPIKTASFAQARKQIYNSSINSWKNYEDDLKIFFEKLP